MDSVVWLLLMLLANFLWVDSVAFDFDVVWLGGCACCFGASFLGFVCLVCVGFRLWLVYS